MTQQPEQQQPAEEQKPAQQDKPQYKERAKQPYEVQYEKEIQKEYDDISKMRDEQGKELANKRIKKLQAEVDIKYKKMYNAEQQQIQKKEKELEKQKPIEYITIADDTTVPSERIRLTPQQVADHVDKRVEIHGWCHHVRIQSKKLAFIDLRDGHGFIQIVLQDKCMQIADTQKLCREAAIQIKGKIIKNEKAPTGYEITADFWKLIGEAAGDFENLIQPDSGPDVIAKYRHIVHRGEKGAAIIKLRYHILQLFREHFATKDFTEVNPPTIVNTECEGGSSLFKMDFYKQEAYLTQSSQLYLESVIHALGDCYCIAPSYRAEQSHTRRHLSEFTHLETEHAFIQFEDLLKIIEDMVAFVANELAKRYSDLIKVVSDKIITVKTPFKRMTYLQAIDWLNERNILNDKNEKFQFGDDIAETQERKMIDTIGEPVFLMKFPAMLKSFYMQKCADDLRLTESVDLLVPTVGEIVGGSMRIWQLPETIAAYEREHIPLENYYWYTDVRKYGANPHGGCGLGVDRFVCWLLQIYNIRDSVLYPRAQGTLMP